MKASSIWKAVDIGNILLKLGWITKDQLEKAVEAQKQNERGTRLGEILVGMGAITRDQLHEALSKQKKMRSGKAVDVMVEMVQKRAERLPELFKQG